MYSIFINIYPHKTIIFAQSSVDGKCARIRVGKKGKMPHVLLTPGNCICGLCIFNDMIIFVVHVFNIHPTQSLLQRFNSCWGKPFDGEVGKGIKFLQLASYRGRLNYPTSALIISMTQLRKVSFCFLTGALYLLLHISQVFLSPSLQEPLPFCFTPLRCSPSLSSCSARVLSE